MSEDTGKLHLDQGDRKFELVDYEQFAASGHEPTDSSSPEPSSETMTASGRLIWTWETIDQAQDQAAASQTSDSAEEPTAEDLPSDSEAEQSESRLTQVPARKRKVQEESPEAAYSRYSKAFRRMEHRGPWSVVLCLPAVYGTLAALWGWGLSAGITQYGHFILAGLTVIELVLCYDVLLDAVYDLSRRRFGIPGMTILSALAALLDALTCRGATVPFCAPAMLGLSLGLWSSIARSAACRKSLKLLVQSEDPQSAVGVAEAWEKTSCMVRRRLPPEGFVTDLETPDLSGRVLGIYAPAACILALVGALAASLHSHLNYLTCLSAILCAGLPLGGGLCFVQPFARLSKELSHSGAALGGWNGAQACADIQGLILLEQDLLSKGSVTNTGLKVYGDHTPSQVVGYCYTVLSRSGGRLAEALEPLAEQYRVRQSSIGEYKVYEGGGLGAEIQGNVVLVGSLSFMRLMGVILPQGAAVKQAVYVSVNGELAGIVGIHYEPASPARSALAHLQSERGLRLILATGDFLLTPAFVKSAFRLRSDRFIYPSAAQRASLAQGEFEDRKKQVRAGILTTEGLRPMTKVLLGGRNLVKITRINLICCLLGGILGLLLVFYLCFTGAKYSLSAGTVLIYALVWLVPVLTFSRWVSSR